VEEELLVIIITLRPDNVLEVEVVLLMEKLKLLRLRQYVLWLAKQD
jgi:hypothetical protein